MNGSEESAESGRLASCLASVREASNRQRGKAGEGRWKVATSWKVPANIRSNFEIFCHISFEDGPHAKGYRSTSAPRTTSRPLQDLQVLPQGLPALLPRWPSMIGIKIILHKSTDTMSFILSDWRDTGVTLELSELY